MSVELFAKLLISPIVLVSLVCMIKFVSNFSISDPERWNELGKPYFSSGGHGTYMKEIMKYHKFGKAKALQTYSVVYRYSVFSLFALAFIAKISEYYNI